MSTNAKGAGRFAPQVMCPHLKAYRASAMRNLPIILQHLLNKKVQGGKVARLFVSSPYPTLRQHVCLHCTFVGQRANGTLTKHAQTEKHYIALDVARSQLWCFGCNDYVYDRDFEKCMALVQAHVSQGLEELPRVVKRARYHEWVPSNMDVEAIRAGSESCSLCSWKLGLRGLNNLGNTCFMNCIIQAMVHNPPLRNYFLGDLHNRKRCRLRAELEKSKDECRSKGKQICMGCEMDAVFEEMFSGNISPLSPHHFLHAMWNYDENLAGYEQQDAHEFLISSLNGLHDHCHGSSRNCNCIVHRVFSGVVRSDVICLNCKSTSSSYEPFFDISLDLRSHNHAEEMENDAPVPQQTLYDCLKRFTWPEPLGSDQKIMCEKCQTKQECMKQMSVKRFPIVLCFHLKRFEQNFLSSSTTKIESFVEFPVELDMSAYHSSTIVKQRVHGTDDSSCESVKYDLFAVVNHFGTMESGHYTSYVRKSNRWFECDDAWVTDVGVDDVLSSSGWTSLCVRNICVRRRVGVLG